MDFGLMGTPRALATKLLRAMLRYAPEERRPWVEAMLRELDFVEKEWAALTWALGCSTAIFRECLRGWGTWIRKQCSDFFKIKQTEEGSRMNSTGKKTLGVVAGMGIALAFGVCAFFLAPSIATILQGLGIPRTMGSHLLSVLLPTEAILVVAAIVLWRRKLAPIAVGLLATAFVMAAHVAVTLANR